MKITYQSLVTYIVGVLIAYSFSACEDDMVDNEFKLSGDISSMIPDYSVLTNVEACNVYDGYQYIKFSPNINADLDKWGLKISLAKYYIDNVLVSTINQPPFTLNYRSKDIDAGKHNGTGVFVISGEGCDDVTLKNSDSFITTECKKYESYGDIYLDYNYVFKGDILQMIPHINEERSKKGCKIKKVSYYWDNKLMLETSQEPYDWNFKISDEADTKHEINVNVDYICEAYPNVKTSYGYIYSGFTILKDDESRVDFRFKSSSSAYKNGETVKATLSLYKGKNCKDKYYATVYFDEKEILNTNTFPYDVSYVLKGESIGIHNIVVKWNVEKADGTKYSSGTKYTIVVNS